MASIFIIGGILMIVHPLEMFIPHPDELYSRGGSPQAERVTKQKAREIGGGAILIGVVFASLVIYRPRE